MDLFLSIYSKLLISIISFAAPVFTYIVTTYIDGRAKIIFKLNEQKKNISKLITKEVSQANPDGSDMADIIKKSHDLLVEKEKDIQKKVNLLNFFKPKKCIIRLFVPLFLALLLLFFASLVRGNVLGMYNHYVSIILLSLSCASFTIAMIILWLVAWKLIDAKELLAEEVVEIKKENETTNVEAVKG